MKFSYFLILVILCAASLPLLAAPWESQSSKTDYDHPPLIGQRRSLIRWGDDPNEQMNIQRWIIERDLKDLEPGWKVRQRLAAEPERVGKVLSCIGDCKVFRGVNGTRVRWLSRIEEGDEIHTGANSYVWVHLIDGTLVRIAPLTSIGFLEVNITKESVFFQARLNQGYVHWQPRSGRKQKMNDMLETDPLFLPLMDPEANVGWFQQRIYQGSTEDDLIYMTVSTKPLGQSAQQRTLNEKIEENNKHLSTKNHKTLFVAPNGSLLFENIGVTWFYGVANKSYFKVNTRDDEEEGERAKIGSAQFLFRGYANDKTEDIPFEKWMSVDIDGREMMPINDVPTILAVTEILPKRITTLMLARENILAKSKPMWEVVEDQAKLASLWGYRLWSNELETRINFLKEHTRRLETTNLRSLQKLNESVQIKGEVKIEDFDERYFVRALDSYYNSMKQRHAHSKESVRDMSPLHYYGWMLKNARQQ